MPDAMVYSSGPEEWEVYIRPDNVASATSSKAAERSQCSLSRVRLSSASEQRPIAMHAISSN
jgi:hypothetical protein